MGDVVRTNRGRIVKRTAFIDDDDDIRLLAGMALREIGGYQVDEFPSGAAAQMAGA